MWLEKRELEAGQVGVRFSGYKGCEGRVVVGLEVEEKAAGVLNPHGQVEGGEVGQWEGWNGE